VAAALTLPARLPLITPRDGLMLRICSSAFADREPCFRATRSFRFDDPNGEFETLYCAASFETCYHETVVRDRPLDAASGRILIPRAAHDSKTLSIVLVDWSRLRMVHLCDDGAHQLGCDAAMLMGADYLPTQALGRALYEHLDAPHGAVYRSRFNMSSHAIVLFDRARAHVRLHPAAKPTPLTEMNEAFLALTMLPVPLALV
jgi:hypothetical protein